MKLGIAGLATALLMSSGLGSFPRIRRSRPELQRRQLPRREHVHHMVPWRPRDTGKRVRRHQLGLEHLSRLVLEFQRRGRHRQQRRLPVARHTSRQWASTGSAAPCAAAASPAATRGLPSVVTHSGALALRRALVTVNGQRYSLRRCSFGANSKMPRHPVGSSR